MWPATSSSPRGSKYPIFKDSGPKNHTLDGFWDQRPQILGTWTLKDPPELRKVLHPCPRPLEDYLDLQKAQRMAQYPTIREYRQFQYRVHYFGAVLPILSVLGYWAIVLVIGPGR